MKTQHTHRNYSEIIVGLVLLLLLAGGGVWWMLRTTKPKTTIQQPIPTQVDRLPSDINKTKVVPAPITKTIPPITTTITQLKPQAYWLKIDENGDIFLVPQSIAVDSGVTEAAALKTAFKNLLENIQPSNVSSTIPSGTRLLSLEVTESGIYVNLSQEFASGGGTTSMVYRVAQVLYTASSLDSQANIYLSVEGKLLDENNPLGGEGLILTEPLTREQFAKDFSIATI